MKSRLSSPLLWLPLLTFSVFEAGTAQIIQGATECTEARGFNLCQNLAYPASGSNYQRSTALRAAASAIAWSTEYNWAGSDCVFVKSFANAESKAAKGLQVKVLPLMTTLWNWKYEGRSSALKAIVAIDILIGSTKERNAGSKPKSFEIKIWLANAGGIQPLGSKIDEAECIAGYDWFVWRGVEGGVQTITFVNQEPNEDITSFDGDLGDFIYYLVEVVKIPESYYIQSVKAGNEVYSGTANFYTSVYQLWIEFPGE